MNPRLRHKLSEYQYLRERLIAEFPETDEVTLRDTLEGLSSLGDVLAAVVRSYLDDLTLAAAVAMRIDEMEERLSRIEHRADTKRKLVTRVMTSADIKTLAEPDLTASLRTVPPALVVTDEKQVPIDFWKPQAPKLDREGLSAALKSGAVVPGAMLGNAQMTLSVRTK
jgi:hypothetical protein